MQVFFLLFLQRPLLSEPIPRDTWTSGERHRAPDFCCRLLHEWRIVTKLQRYKRIITEWIANMFWFSESGLWAPQVIKVCSKGHMNQIRFPKYSYFVFLFLVQVSRMLTDPRWHHRWCVEQIVLNREHEAVWALNRQEKTKRFLLTIRRKLAPPPTPG